MLYQNISLVFYRQRLERRLKKKHGGGRALTFIMKGRCVGFFSMFFQIIGAVHFCKKYKHNLIVDFVGGPYFEEAIGKNWWKYYFSRKQFDFSGGRVGHDRVLNEWEQKDFSYYGRALASSVGNALVGVVGIHDTVLGKVIDFKNKNMDGHPVVGIHYRGTDKVSGKGKESDRVPYEDVLDYLEKDNGCLFFVATDEQAFLDWMESVFADRVISYNALRSNSSASIHRGDIGGISKYKAGEDALIDCLLLASCNKLVRTDSNLSYACRFFNPRQKSIIMGK